MHIRPLDPTADLDAVAAFYRAAPDYWMLVEGQPPGIAKARDFFTDGPPGCDPAKSHRLGLFLDGRLSGLAELSFGFPEPGDAYLGLMVLGPWARGAGLGRDALAHVETLARAAGSPVLYLAVVAVNTRGRAFWEWSGFTATGHSGTYEAGGVTHTVHRLAKALPPV